MRWTQEASVHNCPRSIRKSREAQPLLRRFHPATAGDRNYNKSCYDEAGDCVGTPALGLRVGDIVGAVVGAAVGTTTGAAVGTTTGAAVGTTTGAAVGPATGTVVGVTPGGLSAGAAKTELGRLTDMIRGAIQAALANSRLDMPPSRLAASSSSCTRRRAAMAAASAA